METRLRTSIQDMADSADAALIAQTLDGNESAFAELVRRYQAAVWGTVHRILGRSAEDEDAVQEVFLRAFSSLRRFDPKYPFGPWVLRIATNHCIDLLRRRGGELIPWAWSVNGGLSVLGSMLTLVLAINFGYTATMLIGPAAYLAAAATAKKL